MNIYDNKDFFDSYSQMSRSVYGLDGAGEWQTFRPLSPDLECKTVLDIGCGYGWHAKYAAENGFDSFTSTLFVSPYQDHELMKKVAEAAAKKYGIEFLYRDFRVGFREGQAEARSKEMYMQKYCGCIFSEEDRYLKTDRKEKTK